MAAALACGPGAALSHESAAQFWGLRKRAMRAVHVTVPPRVRPRIRGVVVHRRELRREDVTKRHGIPVTSPICTLVDLAAKWKPDNVEEAVSQADVLDLVDPETLRAALDDMPRRSGRGALKRLLDRPDFAVTRSRLERAFMRITRRLGLPKPLTRQYVNGFEVDFYWPDLGLVVETDGLKYHRTPQQQIRDRIRDQVHTAAGLTCLRYTRHQIMRQPRQVDLTLAPVANRLLRRPA